MTQDPTVLDIMKRARDILTKNMWTKKTFARTIHGERSSITDPGACKFCTTGAIWRAVYELTGVSVPAWSGGPVKKLHSDCLLEFRMANIDDIKYSIAVWNDRTVKTKDGVLEAFDKTIQQIEERQNGCTEHADAGT